MLTSAQCLKKYGAASPSNPWLVVWDVPTELEIGFIPKKIYCNKDMIIPLTKAFNNLIQRDCVKEIITWDGCFNIRKKRGLTSMSVHSWGDAVDINAANNPLGLSAAQCIAKGLVPFTQKFLKCFRDAGFDCGADWKSRPDGMHFQLATI